MSKLNNRIANSIDPYETARYEPSHLDLHCLRRYLNGSVWIEMLKLNAVIAVCILLVMTYLDPFEKRPGSRLQLMKGASLHRLFHYHLSIVSI